MSGGIEHYFDNWFKVRLNKYEDIDLAMSWCEKEISYRHLNWLFGKPDIFLFRYRKDLFKFLMKFDGTKI